MFGQKLTGRLLLAILIGAGAVAALMIPNFRGYASAPLGLFWGLLAGFCWAIGTFVVKRTNWAGMGLSLTFWQVLITLPPIALGALVFDGLPTHWPSTKALAATIYTGVIPMALGTATWFALVKLLPAQVAALSSIAIPIVAIVSGILLLNEPLSALQAVAIGSTVISLWLALDARPTTVVASGERNSHIGVGLEARAYDERRSTRLDVVGSAADAGAGRATASAGIQAAGGRSLASELGAAGGRARDRARSADPGRVARRRRARRSRP